MKTIIQIVITLVVCLMLMAFSKIIKIEQPVISKIKTHKVVKYQPVLYSAPVIIIKKNQKAFLTAVGKRESGGRYNVINTYGYMGKYQFGRKTLDGLGYKKVTNEEFINSPLLQEEAMNSLLKHNQRKLRKQISKYCGTTVKGVYITESGILAAAHLAGQGNVKRFFRKGYEFKDGYGTTMTSYMSQFSGYNLTLK